MAVDKLDIYQKKEMLQLRNTYYEQKWADRIVLLKKDCYSLAVEDLPQTVDGKAQLFLLDPYFGSNDQPQGQHANVMREFLDMCSKEAR